MGRLLISAMVCFYVGFFLSEVRPIYSNPILFVFGDSYTDTGNTPILSTAWFLPSGMSWPRWPAGRFSDGYSLTDALASTYGFPSPVTYVKFTAATKHLGINFAFGGSGTTTIGLLPKLSAQVDAFTTLTRAGHYSQEVLNQAVVLLSISGNDYNKQKRTLDGYLTLAREVTSSMELSLIRLYSLGLRNFYILSMPSMRCLPLLTQTVSFRYCENTTGEPLIVTRAHNENLSQKMANFTTVRPDSSFLFLLQSEAMEHIIGNTAAFNLTEGLRPCCSGACGFLAAHCRDPSKNLFWDLYHPSHAGWKAIVGVLSKNSGFSRSFGLPFMKEKFRLV